MISQHWVNGLVPSGNKLLPELILNKFYEAIWCYRPQWVKWLKSLRVGSCFNTCIYHIKTFFLSSGIHIKKIRHAHDWLIFIHVMEIPVLLIHHFLVETDPRKKCQKQYLPLHLILMLKSFRHNIYWIFICTSYIGSDNRLVQLLSLFNAILLGYISEKSCFISWQQPFTLHNNCTLSILVTHSIKLVFTLPAIHSAQ